jgi:hypothetical protein
MRYVILGAWLLGLPLFSILYVDEVIKLPRFDLPRLPFKNLPATNGLFFGTAWVGLTLLLTWLCGFLP